MITGRPPSSGDQHAVTCPIRAHQTIRAHRLQRQVTKYGCRIGTLATGGGVETGVGSGEASESTINVCGTILSGTKLISDGRATGLVRGTALGTGDMGRSN